MNLLKYALDETLIIAPKPVIKSLQEEIVKKKLLVNTIFITKDDLYKKVYFDYDLKTISYLCTNYNLRIENALMHLNNLIYLENKNYHEPKLDLLVSIKNDLLQNNLLIEKPLFINKIKPLKKFVIGYEDIEPFFKNVLDYLSNYEVIIDEKINNNNLTVFAYERLNDEIVALGKKVGSLLNSGVDVNQIKLANVTDDYIYTLRKVFNYYNIKINLDLNASLFSLRMGQALINNLKVSRNIDQTLEIIKSTFDLEDNINREIYNSLIHVINSLLFDIDEHNPFFYEALNHLLKTSKLKGPRFDHAVEIIDFENTIIDDETFVFFLNFNQQTCPRLVKDENYLNDELALLLGLNSSYKKNKLSKELLIKALFKTKKLFISYNLGSDFETNEPSLLVNELNMKVIQNEDYQPFITYSPSLERITLAKDLDLFSTYGIKKDKTMILFNNYYASLNYKSYDNSYKPFSHSFLNYSIDSPLKLSFTRLDNYFKCPFQYYCNYHLGLNNYEDSFATLVGNIAHKVLSLFEESDFDFDQCVKDEISTSSYPISPNEEVFLTKILIELKLNIIFLKEHLVYSMFTNYAFEKEYTVKVDDSVILSGKIDKIMAYKEDNKVTAVALFDYKTGGFDGDFKLIHEGINLQLPLYYYFIQSDNVLKDATLVGMYYQKLLNGEQNRNQNKSYQQVKNELLRFQGLSLSDSKLLSLFDSSYVNSRFIKGMKLNKDGNFSANTYKSLRSKEGFKDLLSIVDSTLKQAIKRIKDMDYRVNPYLLKNRDGCKYCPYEDICYKKYEDYRVIKIDEEEEVEEDE